MRVELRTAGHFKKRSTESDLIEASVAQLSASLLGVHDKVTDRTTLAAHGKNSLEGRSSAHAREEERGRMPQASGA